MLRGENGYDTIYGEAGYDLLDGGANTNTLYGGTDTFDRGMGTNCNTALLHNTAGNLLILGTEGIDRLTITISSGQIRVSAQFSTGTDGRHGDDDTVSDRSSSESQDSL